jgi:uncharacterized protein (TIGR04141 family)
MAAKTNKLSICLIKSEFTRFDQIVVPDSHAVDLANIGTFYVEDSHPRPPDWLGNFFGELLTAAGLRLLTSSAKGALLVQVTQEQKPYIFAVLFGFGRHLLNDDVIEERFGLKVVLNSVDHQSIRSIDKTTLGSVPKQSREQMSRESVVADFGIDIEQDLVSAVTGRSRVSELGKTISGRDALSVNVKVDASNIKDFLLICLQRYLSDEYKANFGWIDQIKQVRNSALTQTLDNHIVDALNNGQFDNLWMATPEIVDWMDVGGFRYRQAKRSPLKTDLDTHEFLQTLQDEPVTIDILKQTPIHLISATTDEPADHWSAYKCVCAEVDHNGMVYVLNNGKWYEVINDFAAIVKQDFTTLPESTLVLPAYTHATEGAYNDHLPAVVPDSCSMDRQMISYGGGHSSIEFCDLATRDKKLVHIKRYGGSTQLSHLFAQGVVSAELFLQDANFRVALNRKLPAGYKLPNARTRPVAGEYEIVFGIISKSHNPLDIPFFSKVGLRNARRRLEAYGYRVTKKKIAHQ